MELGATSKKNKKHKYISELSSQIEIENTYVDESLKLLEKMKKLKMSYKKSDFGPPMGKTVQMFFTNGHPKSLWHM